MGRRNETNRLAHKKKADHKKKKEQSAEVSRKEKLKAIVHQFQQDRNTESKTAS